MLLHRQVLHHFSLIILNLKLLIRKLRTKYVYDVIIYNFCENFPSGYTPRRHLNAQMHFSFYLRYIYNTSVERRPADIILYHISGALKFVKNSPLVKRYYFPTRKASLSRDELNVFELNAVFRIVKSSLDITIVAFTLLKIRSWRCVTSIGFLINYVKLTID